MTLRIPQPPSAPSDRLALGTLSLLGGAASVGLLVVFALYLPTASGRYIDRYAALILALILYGPPAFISGTLATRGFLHLRFGRAGASRRSTYIATAVLVAVTIVFLSNFR